MKRVSRLLVGGVLAAAATPWLSGVLAHADTAPPPPSGDTRATSVAGNATTCADIGLGADSQVGQGDSSGLNASGFTVTSDGQYLTVSAVPANTKIDALVIKGGDAYNLYPSGAFTTLPVSGLHAPLVGKDGNVPQISHWFLCYGPTPPQQTVNPDASIAGTCSGADVTLTAGSSDTTFTITRAGDATGQNVTVPAGTSTVQHVTLDTAHPSVSVAAGGPALDSFSRQATCDNTNNDNDDDNDDNGCTSDDQCAGNGAGGSSGGAVITNPKASADNACRSGITLTLTNVGGTAPVVFTVINPDGATSTVSVGAGKTVQRSYAVTEDSTGVVTVSAPGMSTRTFRYHKDCATVLGVKHTKHTKRSTHADRTPPAGGGIGAAALPFTGFGAERNAIGGALLMFVGALLCRLGARRRISPRSGR